MNFFVYGTLKTNGYFWRSTFAPVVGLPDLVRGFDLYDLGRFPAICKSKNKLEIVYGEVFVGVDNAMRDRLDGIEGYPSLYDRAVVTTGSGIEAIVYFMRRKPNGATHLAMGRWDPSLIAGSLR